MNAKSLLCLLGILTLHGLPLQASGDDTIGSIPPNAIGSIQLKTASSPGSVLGKYKQYVYLVVGSYWYPAIDRAYSSIPEGKVRIRFTITSAGNLENVEVIEGKKFKKLAEISLGAMWAPAPFHPFNQELIKQIGEKYTDEFSFSFGGKADGSSATGTNTVSGPSPYSML